MSKIFKVIFFGGACCLALSMLIGIWRFSLMLMGVIPLVNPGPPEMIPLLGAVTGIIVGGTGWALTGFRD